MKKRSNRFYPVKVFLVTTKVLNVKTCHQCLKSKSHARDNPVMAGFIFLDTAQLFIGIFPEILDCNGKTIIKKRASG
ncbi:MAG: hypothetical protein JW902_08995 [Syntrophaceae bacterium]|nr:hypothetical protein [Syntrophaceae bacterium]